MMMKMIRANWVDLAQGCGVVAGIFLAIHLITAGVLFWGRGLRHSARSRLRRLRRL